MAMAEYKSELHKEFELERLILFSDAVFAIAITLIIIEIKFPDIEKGATSGQIWQAFKPTIIQFIAFVLSFFFISTLWMRHLQIFRFLHKYDKGLIRRNLFFLFFIVCFPFSASGITEHIRPGFILPFLIYIINLAAVMVCQYFLCQYIFQKKPQLCREGNEAEKNYILLTVKWFAIVLSATAIIYMVEMLFFPYKEWSIAVPIYLVAIFLFLMRRRIKKYKPVPVEEV